MATRDETVKKDVVNQLYWDSRVDASDIQVTVNNGVVTLSGSVSDLIAKKAAAIDASVVYGVRSVENNLNVQYLIEVGNDSEIQSRIKNIFTWSSGIDASKIDVSVSAGWVSLEGSVRGFMEKMRAEELSSNVAGVVGVTNELAIVPAQDFTDEKIAEDIIAAVIRTKDVDINVIDVKVQKRIVTLSGTVPNGKVLRVLHDVARYTYGVVEVISNLAIVDM